MTKKSSRKSSNQIADNRKASHDYQLQEHFEAGLVLEGWEVKSLRAGRAQLRDSYVRLIRGEAWLVGAHISPLSSASTHVEPDSTRSRKLLLNERELNKIRGAINKQGLTVVPLNMHWQRGRVKLDIAIAKGKKLHDKRDSEKKRDWQRTKQRILSNKT